MVIDNDPHKVQGTVDGSGIPNNHLWMVLKPVVNNGISTTNLNWLAGVLNHQQYGGL